MCSMQVGTLDVNVNKEYTTGTCTGFLDPVKFPKTLLIVIFFLREL